MPVVTSKNGYSQVIWQSNVEMSKLKVPCCERYNSISARWKIFFLMSFVGVISIVTLTSYNERCGFSTCSVVITPQSPKVISRANLDLKTTPHVFVNNSKPDPPNDPDDSGDPADVEYDDTPGDWSKLGIPPHPPHARRRLPQFILIGTKKSGTRALLNYINMHPDIATAGHEVHFFDRDELYDRGLEWYRKQMPYTYPDQLTGEKSPSYYRIEEVPERVFKMNSSIKLIVVVKEPIDRAMSNYLQFQSKRIERGEPIPLDNPTFEESVLDQHGDVRANSPHIKNSHYYLFLKNWLKYFPLKQMLFVDGNLLIKKPWEVMAEAQEFLGIRRAVTIDDFELDEKKGFYCYRNFSKTPEFNCFNDSKGRKHPSIAPELREKLSEYFKPRNIQFFRAIKKTFEWNT